MTPWIIFSILTIVYFFLAENSPKNRHVIYIIYGIAFTIFSTLRFDVGYDYPAYWDCSAPIEDSIFTALTDKYDYNSPYYLFGKQELIPKIFYLIVEHIGWRPLLFIIYGSLTYYLVFKGIEDNTKNIFIGVTIYIAFFYCSSLGIIRQALSYAIVFFSYRYVKRKQLVRFIIAISLSGLVHKTGYTMFILYPMYYYLNYKSLWLIMVVIFVYKTLFVSIFASYFNFLAHLSDERITSGNALLKYLFLLIDIGLFVINYYTSNKLIKDKKGIFVPANKDSEFILRMTHNTVERNRQDIDKSVNREYNIEENNKLMIIVHCGVFLNFIGFGLLSVRMAEYFLIFLVLLIPNLVDRFNNNKTISYLLHCLGLMYFIISIYWLSIIVDKPPFTPYRCVLMTNTEIFKF